MTTDTFPMTVGGVLVRSEAALLNVVENGPLMSGTQAVRFIIIHCSATRADRPYTAQQLERDHRAQGFRTVGYHFYIRRDGTLTQHRRLLEVGAHARPYNRCSIGICYEGERDPSGQPSDTRTAEQRARLAEFTATLHSLFPEARVVSHHDLPGAKPKACPCFDAFTEYNKW